MTADKAALIHDGRREKVTDEEDGGRRTDAEEQDGEYEHESQCDTHLKLIRGPEAGLHLRGIRKWTK